MEKNEKEWKRTERTEKNGKNGTFFEKNRCPTLFFYEPSLTNQEFVLWDKGIGGERERGSP